MRIQSQITSIADMKVAFTAQQQASRSELPPSYAFRIEQLKCLQSILLDNQQQFAQAMYDDYSGRSLIDTRLGDLLPTANAIKHNIKHLKKWMRPRKQKLVYYVKPSSGFVLSQPLGVVGVMAPWNFPIQLLLIPLASAIAAGNRVMIKPSELTPNTTELMASLIAEKFDPLWLNVVSGGSDIGAAFVELAFDHLFFTGSTNVGHLVMQAAAKNLTPVTLELGGKSPLIIHREYPLSLAAKRIAMGKLFNAGQVCVAPDYILTPKDLIPALVEELKTAIAVYAPTLRDNIDYTAIINERHLLRLQHLIDDARSHNAEILEINPAAESLTGTRKIAPHLLWQVNDDMAIMQEEIFGPLLPIVGYDIIADAIAYVNARPRPLALYYFDNNKKRQAKLLSSTIAGGVAINTIMMQIAQENLPFGGIGPSGMGAYHGETGFRTFSHEMSVFVQSRFAYADFLQRPMKPWFNKIWPYMIGRTNAAKKQAK
ncbi:MAG: coniferyl aldehyde dehydrogenase [Deltaproteobacteria bacterium]|nr:coniferyl aldehyde dehydrogenase [Deltaproteobacteria bacterium]